MSNKIDWESVSMGIIAESGASKSLAMEALFEAKKGKYESSDKKIKEAETAVHKAAKIHFEVIQQEAAGQQLEYRVIFLHAEDQLLTTQTLIILVKELIDLHRKIDKR